MGVSKVIYNGKNLIDLTGDTVSPETLAKGITAHDMAGNKITGTMVAGGGVTAGKSYRLMIKVGSSVISLQQFFNVFSGLIGAVIATQEVIVDTLPDADFLLNLDILGFYIVTGGGTPSVYVGAEVAFSDFVNEVANIGEIFSVLAPYNGVANSEAEMTSNGTWLLIQDENQVVTEYGNGAYVALDGMKFRTIDMLPQVKELDISQTTNFNSPDVSVGLVADEGRHLQAVAVKNSRAGQTYNITSNGTHSGLLGYDEVSVNVPAPPVSVESRTVTPSDEEQIIIPSTGYDWLSRVTVKAIPSDHCDEAVQQVTKEKNAVEFKLRSLIDYTDKYYFNDLTADYFDGVIEIRPYAFYKFTSIYTVEMPDTVKKINDYAFAGCGLMHTIKLPNGITTISNGLFESCSNLTNITIPNSVTSIGYRAFYYCVDLTSITIPNLVTVISSEAFKNCRRLTSIAIPNSVTTIGNSAFYYCDRLTSVTIGNSVTYIGDSAFVGCDNLQYNEYGGAKYLGNSNNPYHALISADTSISDCLIEGRTKVIGNRAFEACTSLTNITIPEGVTHIGDYAFNRCIYATSITIPSSLVSIGVQAFNSCNQVKDIYYGGSKTMWEAIEKGSYWDLNTTDYTVHCTDGDIAKS